MLDAWLQSTGTCDFPINAVGVDGDSNNVITLGPFYEPGTYRFCVSKDGGQVYFLQARPFFFNWFPGDFCFYARPAMWSLSPRM